MADSTVSSATERTPIKSAVYGAKPAEAENGPRPADGITGLYEGNIFEASPENRRQLGVFSATLLIFNRVIGTGIFATPGTILSLSGSVGLSLFMWVIGTFIAMAGTAVYMEWGTAIPKNGGEKNYLEYVYKKPKFLATAMFAAYAFLLGWAASNSVVFGQYILNAAEIEVDRWNQRGIGLACLTAAFLVHSIALKWGIRLQNLLGIIKLIIILFIVVSGWVALAGHTKAETPHNFRNAFEGTKGSGYSIVMALYNVIWSFIGYSNANYALSETKNPVRTLKIAAPLAIGTVGILYMFVNIAYFAAVSKEEMLESGTVVAAVFFGNMFGKQAEKVMSVFVALSAFGNVLSVLFSQGRGGLIYIYLNRSTKYPNWNPGIRATLPVTVFFLLSNVYLVIAPYVPPDAGQNVYEQLPYYLHCVVALGLFAFGALYYVVWAVLLPRWGGYVLVKESVVDADGWSRSVFTRLPLTPAGRP
ncbi:High-affinity methionine permease [Penicillium subrubescens]|uniref:High-affinity methionine permease n=1 Tax=Penicillium subrubescens TaxID=1316194 RepID=A0A1Q5URX9_9EURO|nr:High-affinity methionine permease [Penicillium subrubescens]